MVVSGKAAGALVCGGVSFLIRPGRKKLAGEMLSLALMPLHPAPRSASATGIASHKKILINLTCPV